MAPAFSACLNNWSKRQSFIGVILQEGRSLSLLVNKEKHTEIHASAEDQHKKA